MGLFKKMKDILFDEEEYTEPIKITPEMRNEDIPFKEEKEVALYDEEKSKPREDVKEEKKEEIKAESKRVTSERELFNSSNFPLDFDELEFANQTMQQPPIKKVEQPRKLYDDPYEIERRKRIEKRTDYGTYEKVQVVETTERKKFKPSPIISPVYGVLDKDYTKDDVFKKDDVKVNVDEARRKAFGEKEKPAKEETPVTTFYEETETVTLIDPKEKEKKVKTIDELLEDTSDVSVDIDKDIDTTLDIDKIESPKKVEEEKSVESTNDLFDLIDSMYDNSEDGE